MDDIEKLLAKVSRKERVYLLEILMVLRSGTFNGLQVKKLRGTALYRVRVGTFRTLFSMGSSSKTIVIESIKRRNERTYRDV